MSEIDLQIRVAAFLNGEKPDFNAASKRSAGERLVDQRLIQREMELSRYPGPADDEINAMFEQVKKEQASGDADFERKLAEYGITAADLREQLRKQIMLLRFIDVRFKAGIQVSDSQIRDYFEKQVKPAHPGGAISIDDYREEIEEALLAQLANEQADAWLKDARKRTEIEYHEEALQ